MSGFSFVPGHWPCVMCMPLSYAFSGVQTFSLFMVLLCAEML